MSLALLGLHCVQVTIKHITQIVSPNTHDDDDREQRTDAFLLFKGVFVSYEKRKEDGGRENTRVCVFCRCYNITARTQIRI